MTLTILQPLWLTQQVYSAVTVHAIETITTLQNPFPIIIDSKSVDYMSYIPTLQYSEEVKAKLPVTKPILSIKAKSAILLKEDGTVLYYKNALKPVFPASTAKVLSVLVAVDWCDLSEKITVGDEIEMIAEDASVAGLKKGDKLSIYSLLAAMLLPSGNDAAYVVAAHVGKKSLADPNSKPEDAVIEYVRLMNEKATSLGAENSCFITPDGYDAIGQYTTAYDMGMITLEVLKKKTLVKLTQKCRLGVTLSSGKKLTFRNTNLLINKTSAWYNSSVIGLKTGTTTMAGKCLISAAQSDNGYVISVVMNSTTSGRWSDSNKLLEYGLQH